MMYLWTPLVRVYDTFPMDTISGFCMYTILGVFVDTLKDTFTLTTVSRYGLLDTFVQKWTHFHIFSKLSLPCNIIIDFRHFNINI